MAEAYRGLTIRFAADAKPVLTTMRSMSKAAADVQSELSLVQRALRFDPTNGKAAREQLKLLSQQAGIAQSKAAIMRREYQKLAAQKIDGTPMRELSARTRDAGVQASLAREQYNALTEQLAVLRLKLRDTWKNAGFKNNPFSSKDAWDNIDSAQLDKYLDKLRKAGAISKAEADKMAGAFEKLKPAFNAASAEYKKFNDIASFQSWGRKAMEEAAKAKAALAEMNAAAKAARPTEFTAEIQRAHAASEKLAASGRKLREALRVNPSSFGTAARLIENTKNSITALKAENKSLEAEINKLGGNNGVRELASDFDKLMAAEREADAALEKYGAALQKVESESELLENSLRELRVKLEAAGDAGSAEYKKIESQIEKATIAQKMLNSEVSSARMNYALAENMAQQVTMATTMRDNVAAIAANNAAITTYKNSMKGVRGAILPAASAIKSLGMTMYSSFTPMAMMGGMYAIQSAKDVDAAYRNMRKTVDGTEEDFTRLRQAAIDFGNTHFTSADQILEIESLGGQLGIAAGDLEEFSTVVSNMDIAAESLDSETIALKLGQLSNILKLTKQDWEGFGDAVVRLGNNSPTLERNIMEIMSRISPLGALVGMTADQLLGWSTAIASTGQKSESAGTAIARTISQIETAVALGTGSMDVFTESLGMSHEEFVALYGSDSAAAASVLAQAIGSSSDALEQFAAMAEMSGDEFMEAFETDPEAVLADVVEALEGGKAKLEDFAAIAGMTAQEFADKWNAGSEGASEAMRAFIGGLKELEKNGGSADAALQNMGITGVRQKNALEGLTTTYDILNDSLQMSYDAFHGIDDEWGAAGDAAREAGKKAEGFSGTLQILLNNGQALASMVGEAFVPKMQFLLEVVQKATDAFSKMDDGQKDMVTTLILMAATSGPVLTFFASAVVMARDLAGKVKAAYTAEQVLIRANQGLAKSGGSLSAKYVRVSSALADATAMMQQEAAMSGTVSTATKERVRNLQREEKALRRGATAASAFKSAMKFAGVMVAFEIIMQIVSAVEDFIEKAEKAEKATSGLDGVMSGLAPTMAGFSDKYADIAKASLDAASGIDEQAESLKSYADEAAEAIDAAGEFVDKVGEIEKETGTKNKSLQTYYDVIKRFADRKFVNADGLAELKIAVEGINELAGTAYEVGGSYEDGYHLIADGARVAKDEVLNLIEAQKLLNMAKGYQGLTEEADAAVAEQADVLQVAQQQYDGAQKTLEEFGKQYGKNSDVYVAQEAVVKEFMATRDKEMAQMKRLEKYQANIYDNMVLAKTAAEDLDGTAAAVLGNAYLVNAFNNSGKSLRGLSTALDNAGVDAKAFAEMSPQLMEKVSSSFDGTFASIYQALQEHNVALDETKTHMLLFAEGTAFAWDTAKTNADAALSEMGMSAADYVYALQESGISMETLRGLTDEQLSAIATSAGTNFGQAATAAQVYAAQNNAAMQQVAADTGIPFEKLQQLNALGLDPKQFTVTDEGTIQDQYGNVWDLDKMTVNNKEFEVSDGGSIEIEGQKIERLKGWISGVQDNKTTYFYGDAWQLYNTCDAVERRVGNLPDSKTVRIITEEVTRHIDEGGSKAGGVIPGHMAGGILSGSIVAQPTLTNYGWVGEAGAEAIIPLSNKHYVRPFAQAVASEMGVGAGTEVVNYNISIDGNALASDARLMGAFEAFMGEVIRKSDM